MYKTLKRKSDGIRFSATQLTRDNFEECVRKLGRLIITSYKDHDKNNLVQVKVCSATDSHNKCTQATIAEEGDWIMTHIGHDSASVLAKDFVSENFEIIE